MRINRDFIVREIVSENGEKTYYAVATGKAAKDYVPKQEEGEADGKG